MYTLLWPIVWGIIGDLKSTKVIKSFYESCTAKEQSIKYSSHQYFLL